MRRVALARTEVQTLFYENEGLLLTAGLVPVDIVRSAYSLVFQLSYLGSGEISVQVAFQQCHGTGLNAPAFAQVDLLGTARGRLPSIWTTSAVICEEQVNCRLVVWGEPGVGDLLRGELVAEVSGKLPLLSASSRATVTTAALPN